MRYFEEQIQELLKQLVLMGCEAESMIHLSMRMLMERNASLETDIFQKENEVNQLEMEIDDRAVKLTALQQPVAADVRFLFMAQRIAGELERIADQAVNITQNSRVVLQQPALKPLIDIPIMADLAQKMVRDSLDALAKKDVTLAERVWENEEKVDAFRDQVFRELLTYMMSDPGTIPRALSLILISRNLERVGDHASNIAEEVVYLVKGRDVRHKDLFERRNSQRGLAEPNA